MQQTSIIPKPKTYGPFKNIPHIKKGELSQTFWRLADELGPIFQFEFSKATSIFVSNHELFQEICDESRFDKYIGTSLNKVRSICRGWDIYELDRRTELEKGSPHLDAGV